MHRAVDMDLLVRNAWAIALRALLASAFGACVIVARGLPMPALVIAYGMYAVVDGLFAVFASLQRRRANEGPRWAYLLVGLSGIGLGLALVLGNGMTVAQLVSLVAASALVSGLAQIAGAVRLRQQVRGEWLLALGGLLGVAFGIAAVAFSVGSATLASWIGGYRLLDGAILCALALRLRRWQKQALAPVVTEPVIDISFEPTVEIETEMLVEAVPEPVAEALPVPPVASSSAHG